MVSYTPGLSTRALVNITREYFHARRDHAKKSSGHFVTGKSPGKIVQENRSEKPSARLLPRPFALLMNGTPAMVPLFRPRLSETLAVYLDNARVPERFFTPGAPPYRQGKFERCSP